jgi:type IV secretory pathway VirB10-like protein
VSDRERDPERAQGARSPLDVPAPVVRRLNRNALYVVLGLMGLTVSVAIASLSSAHASGGRGVDSVATPVPITPQRPALPPLRVAVRPESAITGQGVPLVPTIAFEQSRGGRSGAAARAYEARPRGAPTMGRDGSDAAYRRALSRGPLLGDRAGRSAGEESDTVPAAPASASDQALERELLAPLAHGVVDGRDDAREPDAAAPRVAREHREFLSDARVGAGAPAPTVTSVDEPATPYEIEAGAVIPAALVTEVNSDLPGTVVAQVSRDVYDSRSESVVLVPAGARLVGRYDDRVVTGQSRVLIAWTRLLLPDGRSIALPGEAATDGLGATGVPGAVNTHLGRLFGTASVLSLLSAGAELSQPRTSGSVFAAPSVEQTIAGAAGTELSSVGTELVRQGLEVKPTIVVPAGATVAVLLANDLVFAEPYSDRRL